MTPRCHAELEAWLQADRRHRGAWLRAQAALHLLEDTALRTAPALAQSGNDSDYRRGTWPGVVRWAIAAGLMLCLFPAGLTFQRQRVVDLADGSVATLDSDARILARIDARSRIVVLLSGEARFEVARDPARPFVVRAGGVSAQATGTVYSVDRSGHHGASVHVDEGSVLVWADDARDQAVLLHAGSAITLDPAAAAPDRADSRDGDRIALQDERVVDAAARFNRINRVQIEIDDPAIAGVRIVGLFRANDPYAFANAAAAVAGGCVTAHLDRIVIGQTGCGVTKN